MENLRKKLGREEDIIEEAAARIIDLALLDLMTAAVDFVVVDQLKKRIFSRKAVSWVSVYLKTFSRDVMNVLMEYDKEKTGELEITDLDCVFIEMMSCFGIEVSEEDIDSFRNLIGSGYHGHKLSFFNCVGLVEEWARKNPNRKTSAKDLIEKSVKDYKLHLKNFKGFLEISDFLEELLFNFNVISGRNQSEGDSEDSRSYSEASLESSENTEKKQVIESSKAYKSEMQEGVEIIEKGDPEPVASEEPQFYLKNPLSRNKQDLEYGKKGLKSSQELEPGRNSLKLDRKSSKFLTLNSKAKEEYEPRYSQNETQNKELQFAPHFESKDQHIPFLKESKNPEQGKARQSTYTLSKTPETLLKQEPTSKENQSLARIKSHIKELKPPVLTQETLEPIKIHVHPKSRKPDSFLNKSVKKNSAKTKQVKLNQEDLQIKGLREIFAFYSRQLKQVGQFPTFSQISDHQTVLNLSKYTKFCSDFEVISTARDKHKVHLVQIANIFLKSTNCKRIMNFTEFLLSIDYLSEAFYNEQYDIIYSERLSILNTEHKRRKFLVYLQCENPEIYNQRLKGFGLAFSLEKKGFRLPEYDLSRQYKYKDLTKVKEKIENWKNLSKEEEQSRSNSVPSHARLKAIQQSILSRPDRVTWDVLNKSSIKKSELEKLLEEEDINELLKCGIKIL